MGKQSLSRRCVPSFLWHCALQVVSTHEVLELIAWLTEVALTRQKDTAWREGGLRSKGDIAGARGRAQGEGGLQGISCSGRSLGRAHTDSGGQKAGCPSLSPLISLSRASQAPCSWAALLGGEGGRWPGSFTHLVGQVSHGKRAKVASRGHALESVLQGWGVGWSDSGQVPWEASTPHPDSCAGH